MLLNSRELKRYNVQFGDGKTARVACLLIDPLNWHVTKLVVAEAGLLSRNFFLVDTSNIVSIEHPAEEITLAPTIEMPVEKFLSDPDEASRASNLLSTDKLENMVVRVKDGQLGQTHGFLLETSVWRARYLVVDTGETFSARLIIIPLTLAKFSSKDSGTISFAIDTQTVQKCPEYDCNAEVTREVEAYLYDHFDATPYW